ncbi:rano class II histocompatibility antigen, A beta chain-like [Protopterus annectens]|uniref:rano class II histocompatibility antigen, A beta chain-like n=1 Tax=Protopterus annectens TaxID=7888 RepID=UPI001CFBA09B|nr:rano class II histocompatibility antigen, A beta chain-like [Protopterus annectens]
MTGPAITATPKKLIEDFLSRQFLGLSFNPENVEAFTSKFIVEPSPPSVSGPKHRVDINSSVVVSCVSTGFYPKEINLTWWKNEEELHGFKPDIQPYGADKTYQVQSNITVRAEIDSYVTCKINHTSLDQPINSTFKINDILKVLIASNRDFPSSAVIAGITCGALSVCALLVIFLLHQKRIKGTAAAQNGLVTSNVETEQERHVTSNVDEKREQDTKDDRITYATLQPHQIASRLKNVVQEDSTEYAAVCFKSVPDNDITYVTVNTVKSHTSAKIPMYYIEDHGIEYAAIRRQNKKIKK